MKINALWFCCLYIYISLKSQIIESAKGIGPECPGNEWKQERYCNLPSGRQGTCARECKKPKNRIDTELCCHLKYPNYLSVYYCCEEEVRGDVLPVGGLKTEPAEFPYMVALGWFREDKLYFYTFKCGGAMISSKFLLTAAHCAYIEGMKPAVMVPGGVDLDQVHAHPYTINEVFEHPNYDGEAIYNDIALMELFGSYSGPTINLWQNSNFVNTNFTAIGYGDTSFAGTPTDKLLKVFLQEFPTRICQRFYEDDESLPNGVVGSQICAQDSRNVMDTCQGDSGGPLIMTVFNRNRQKIEYLVGITSIGTGCASSVPGIYTRVSSYLNWIRRVVQQRSG